MQESRHSKRIPLPLKVELTHPSIGTLEVEARDMSDGGLFVLLDKYFQLQKDDIASVKVLGLGLSDKDPGPVLRMKVVRVEDKGMGLEIFYPEQDAETTAFSERHYEVIQTLIICDKNKNILLQKQGKEMQFLSRTLPVNEDWNTAIGDCALHHLKLAGLDTDTLKTLFGSAHYPPCQILNNGESGSQIEHIIPCILKSEIKYSDTQSADGKPDSPYAWVSWHEVNNLSLPLPADVIESLLQKTVDDGKKTT